jgi:hypothetical protein
MPQSRRRSRTKAPEAEESTDEEEATTTEEEAKPKRERSTEPLPSGEELYNAKYVEGMTWQDIRDELDERIRSPKGLALIAEYVIEAGLEDEHPEFADLSDLGEKPMSEAIVEWHDNGQGWSVLAARTGLSQSEVRDIYEDAGGENPGRVGGQRYGGGRSVKSAEAEGEAEDNGDGEEEAPKPARSRRRRGAAAEEEKPVAKPASRSRRRAAKDTEGEDDGAAKPAASRRSRRSQPAAK